MADSLTYSPALPWLARANDGSYGRCLSGVIDLVPGMSTGRLALAEECMRRAITATGTCITNPDYGYDVAQHLNGRIKAADLSEASARLIWQWRSDDRVNDAQCALTFIGGVLIVTGTIFDGEGPFPLTFSVSEAGAQLLKVGTT